MIFQETNLYLFIFLLKVNRKEMFEFEVKYYDKSHVNTTNSFIKPNKTQMLYIANTTTVDRQFDNLVPSHHISNKSQTTH